VSSWRKRVARREEAPIASVANELRWHRTWRTPAEVALRKYACIIGLSRAQGNTAMQHARSGAGDPQRIIAPIESCIRTGSMEAERVNQIANLLSDLQQRTADLRRYL
jgi:hypothetical protein